MEPGGNSRRRAVSVIAFVRIIFYRGTSRRAGIIGDAVLSGLRHHGLSADVVDAQQYTAPDADVAVFYGLAGNLKRLQREYIAAGLKTVFLDLGYWGRLEDGKVSGFHRVVVNGLHATEYFQRVKHGPDRFRHFGIQPQPFKRGGGPVLLCGMSEKAAWVYDMSPEEWERDAVRRLSAVTRREIQYRPKPTWREATDIPGSTRVVATTTIKRALRDAWACVTHHGNTALDALMLGVPAFCVDGIASALACADLTQIESPLYPDEGARDQLLFDAAYTQWKVREIVDGKMWTYLRDEALI